MDTHIKENYTWLSVQNHLISSTFKLYRSHFLNRSALYNSSNYKLSHILPGHFGCVNSLNWSQNGDLLLSGSDDQALVVHKRMEDSSFKIIHRFNTAHSNNIFDAKFSHSKEERIISVAADGRVCVVDAWKSQAYDATNSRTLVASRTSDSAKRIEFLDSSGDNFLVCCEDGHVVKFDLREPTRTQPKSIINLGKDQVSIYSISICPLASHLLAVSGSDPFVRFYDLRKGASRLDPFKLWTPPLKLSKTSNFCSGVRFSRFSYDLAAYYVTDGPYLINPIYQSEPEPELLFPENTIEFSALSEERRRWASIESSHSLGNVDEAETHLRTLILQHRRLQNDPNWSSILAHELYNRVICLGLSPRYNIPYNSIKTDLETCVQISGLWPARYLLIMLLLTQGHIEVCETLCDSLLNLRSNSSSVSEDSSQWISKIEHIKSITAVCELDPAQISRLIPETFADVCKEMPFYNLWELPATKALLSHSPESKNFHGYFGYFPDVLHERTIKGISFVGDQDQYIGVGSDGGYAFLFENPAYFGGKKKKVPVWAVKGDNSVVNVVEGHPHLPCIATSGIDNTVKIWEPTILNETYHEESTNYHNINESDIPALMKRLPTLQPGTRLENVFPLFVDPTTIMFYLGI